MDKGSLQLQEMVSSDSTLPLDDCKEQYYFGCGACRPKVLQFLFRRKKFFTFLLCCLSFLQSGLINGIISVVLSTLERRYNMTSTQAGAMVIMYDVSAVIGIVFVTYFGTKMHQSKLLGIASLVMSIGSLLFASPQFILGRYDNISMIHDVESEQCTSERISDTEDCNNVNIVAYIIFIISNIVLGLAVTPIYTNGVAFLDEIVYPKYVSIHVGLVSTMLITAPLVGLGFGSQFLSIYVDPWRSTSLTEDDPMWVGAWWIPFVIVSVCLALLSVPFFMFPRHLPDTHLVREERAKEMTKVYSSKFVNESSVTIIFKTFPIHIKDILTNPSFLFLVFGLCSTYLFFQGIVSFGPKYYEVQYIFTPSTAGLIAGGVGIPGAILGTLAGAFIVFGCKMKGRSNALFISVTTVIVTFLSFVFLLHCPSAKVVGVTVPYKGSQEECERSCNCTLTSFEPVCGSDDLTYFSPCSAGCVGMSAGKYNNCSCINDHEGYNVTGSAISGYCESQQCLSIVIPAITILGIFAFIVFTITLPYIHAIIRVVADEQRALAMGVQSALTRTLGTIPGPLIFGALFDTACISWQEDCGRRGNCWIYDGTKLSHYVISLGLPCMAIAALCFILAWLTWPNKPKLCQH